MHQMQLYSSLRTSVPQPFKQLQTVMQETVLKYDDFFHYSNQSETTKSLDKRTPRSWHRLKACTIFC